jgi:hypothetical protein
VTLHRRWDGYDPLEHLAEVHEHRHLARAGRLGTGTLACAGCDAPIALAAARMSPRDPLGCPFCGQVGTVRDFLSLAPPSRPARVDVRVVPRSTPRA